MIDDQAKGSVVHSWRMNYRNKWAMSTPPGKKWSDATKNLKNFLPALADFADADGSNVSKGRMFVSQAKLAKNLNCSAETIGLLYEAAEATGLVRLTRTPKGRVNGYSLLFLLGDRMPDWDAAYAVLMNSRQVRHKRTQAAKADLYSETSSRDEEMAMGADRKFSSRDAGSSRHVTDETSSRDGTTRVTSSLNHEMAGSVEGAADTRGEGLKDDSIPGQQAGDDGARMLTLEDMHAMADGIRFNIRRGRQAS